MMKVLTLDIYGDYAHFRKFYTTSSPLTFSFPPPPTVKGILGAILGIGKDEYLKTFSSEKCKIAIRLLNPVKKVRMGLNLVNTKDGYWIPVQRGTHEPRTQIKTEFLKEPCFRMYIKYLEEPILTKLVKSVEEHKTFYTPCFGLSELLADFSYVGLFESEDKNNGFVETFTVIPVSSIVEKSIEFEEGKKYFKEKIPIDMNPERVVERYEDVLFESEGKSIKLKLKRYWELENGEKITFL